ncbi:MAG: V-type ATPase subunit [Syntrophorhabdaceae bacterium]|nr:V-type ATPase subunit [Syntrophorhabdaceae bacterium]
MQTTIINDNNNNLVITKKQRIASDLDYLTALLHARYSTMAVEERLIELCRLQNLVDLFQAIYPDEGTTDITVFQRRCVFNLASEIYNFRMYLSGVSASLLDWVLVHFQVENIKILLRSLLTTTPFEELGRYIIYLPGELSLNVTGLANAQSIDDFINIMPKGIMQESLKKAFKLYGEYKKPFFYEAALDSAYFNELVARAHSLPEKDKESIKAIINQEIDIFHLMLILRGRFIYNLPSDLLKPLHIEGTQIPKRFFSSMLNDPDVFSVANHIENRVIDRLPTELGKTEEGRDTDISILERLAWRHYYRLSNQTFRSSHMGLGAVIGYIGIRRTEVANLITISEGIKSKVTPEIIKRRLIIKTDSEGAYV